MQFTAQPLGYYARRIESHWFFAGIIHPDCFRHRRDADDYEKAASVADAAADDATKTDNGDEEETLQLGGKNTS